jgi:membrane-bound lytic murein transglycosylase B
MDAQRMLALFLAEGRDLLQRVDDGLTTLERAPAARAPLDLVFRAVHSLKGMSATVALVDATAALHVAETLLATARDRGTLPPATTRRLLAMADALRAAFDAAERGGPSPEAILRITRELDTLAASGSEAAPAPIRTDAARLVQHATSVDGARWRVDVRLDDAAAIPSARAAIVRRRVMRVAEVLAVSPTADAQADDAWDRAFTLWLGAATGDAPLDAATIETTLAKAQYQQSIIDAINRPAEAVKPWSDYRKIFLTPARIDGGVAFYRENRDALDRIAAQTGVPAEYVVAIMGVETSYGRNTGSYRVLDALYTLAFDHPRRAPFFAGELAQLFALTAQEPQLDLLALKGSYAGAMGMGQFMPSSYRLWAKDGDLDGRRDLLSHRPDVFASIANYFVVHGWERGGPVVAQAMLDPYKKEWVPENLESVHRLKELAERGYRPMAGQPVAEGATVVGLDGDAGREYWLGYRNYYVITRYNHSPMYALAVHQLAQAIRTGAAQ